VDYFLRPKPAYFTIARELRSFTVGVTRTEKKIPMDGRTAAFYRIDTFLEIWGANSTLSEKQVTLEVTSFDLHSDWRHKWSREMVLVQNASTELYKGDLPGQPSRSNASDIPKTIIVSARLLDEAGAVLCRCSCWYGPFTAICAPPKDGRITRPEPFKFIRFPHAEEMGLKVTVSHEGDSLQVSALKPVKGLVFDVVGADVNWGDQAIDVVPDDPQTVKAEGLEGREVKVRFVGDGTARVFT
jgi:beta-mannosidase